MRLTLISRKEELTEIEKIIAKGSRTVGALQKILKSKRISENAKLRLYETVIRPTVLYTRDSWIMSKKDDNKLSIWEQRLLRKIYGGVKMGKIE